MDDLTDEERAAIDAVAGPKTNWKTDLSGGIQRVAIASMNVRPSATPRRGPWSGPSRIRCRSTASRSTPTVAILWKIIRPTRTVTFYRLPTLYASIQKNDFSKDYPIILTSGRLVEYEGGGDETRSNPWLAELQQDMFVEINPRDANNLGVRDGAQVWVEGPEGGKVKVMAMVTNRVGEGVAFMPFHFGGHFQGEDQRSKYPEGADPYVLGESTNTAQTYGYDSVTQMQETKATLCKIWAA